ncbi:hypothetical protein Drose_06025 [Dactylosporangium roseum]|uniref:DUF1918 domain-containing protein n=1 Tax=Dactylosporangium roseum TaxID=47989 RepID=A0ABY5ZBX0_9ACTN|nr:hypothetical protein [Dactylosporangium roseum]UWZ37829.1 hypothetical protein Drose_06025 [Dactylosporangium roseum]
MTAHELKPGDRVRDRQWGGKYTGTVRHSDGVDGVFVAWDNSFVEDQMATSDVELIEDPS